MGSCLVGQQLCQKQSLMGTAFFSGRKLERYHLDYRWLIIFATRLSEFNRIRRVCDGLALQREAVWPGTESNCRHEDLGSRSTSNRQLIIVPGFNLLCHGTIDRNCTT
jgi:hypothetical protein